MFKASSQAQSLVAVLISCLLTATPSSSQNPTSRATRLLDLYEGNDRETLVVELTELDRYQAFTIELQQQGPKWIRAVPAGPERERRRRMAVVFALELAHSTINSPPSWIVMRQVIPWACSELRKAEPSDFERTWLLAADALIQGAGDPHLGSEHARHGRERFPSDSRFRLAEVISRRESKFLANAPGTPLRHLSYGPATPRVDRSTVRTRETMRGFQGLVDDPVVGAEAGLRLGVLNFHLGNLTQSREHFRIATKAASDTFVSYLAHLMMGLSFEAEGRMAEALAEYREAVAIRPEAASGSTALAALLYAQGDREDAVALLRAALKTAPPAFDAWREFGFGSYRYWGEYIDWLRREARR